MRRRSLLFLVPIAMTLSCSHDPAIANRERTGEDAAVLTTVQRFFETMTSKDTAGARAVLDPEGDFVSVRWNELGERVVRRTSFSDYLEGLEYAAETYLERMWDSEVRIHGPIAIVWTPYDFHIDGKFSHCGTNAFQLLRTETGWIITGGTYVVERTGCGESPLGPPVSDASAGR
jgi:hypothetical protein